MNQPNLREQLILDLHTIKALKFGEFKLKSGLLSPYYFDLRVLVSYPHILKLTADIFWEKLRVLYFDIIVGVPYTGIPIATAIGLAHEQTMVFVRKEKKSYGTKKMIEGEFHKGQKAVIVDDVITNGESKFITIKPLEEEGLTVEDIVILIDREQGGPELLARQGYTCHSILKIDEIFKVLLYHKRVPKDLIEESIKFSRQSRKQFLK